MSCNVVVLGSGYAGTGAVKRLEKELGEEGNLVWISDVDHHLVLHEVQRCIRDPSIREKITFPCDEIKAPDTRFIKGRVTNVDCQDRVIELGDGSDIDYDYVLVAIGSQTAFFGIDGLKEHAYTLKSLEDAIDIHNAINEAAENATQNDPARVVIGGAGLTGIQSAGEIAELRNVHESPIEIHLVEGLDNVFPNHDAAIQEKLATLLEKKNITISTGEFISEVTESTIYIGDDTELGYDVLLWTGGITGQSCAQTIEVEKEDRSGRIKTEETFETDDERVFAMGDAALVTQSEEETAAPPTAQAAWQAAEVAGANIARAVRDEPLESWAYEDKGTVISVGEEAVAHDVDHIPKNTFSGLLAKQLKKVIAARWLFKIGGASPVFKAWSQM